MKTKPLKHSPVFHTFKPTDKLMYTAVGFVAALSLVFAMPTMFSSQLAEKSLGAETANTEPTAINEDLETKRLENAALKGSVFSEGDPRQNEQLTAAPEAAVPLEPTQSLFPPALLDEALELAVAKRESVVQIWSKSFNGAGTGWFLTEDTVMTNEHVISSMSPGDLQVKMLNGDLINAEVIAEDRGLDLAVLRLSRPVEGIEPFLVQRTPAKNGDPLLSIGHPSVIGNWAVSAGVVTEESFYSGDALLTSLPINTGASGSAMMNMYGEVVGIVSGFYWGSQDPSSSDPLEPYVYTEIPRNEIVGGSRGSTIARWLGSLGIEFYEAPRR